MFENMPDFVGRRFSESTANSTRISLMVVFILINLVLCMEIICLCPQLGVLCIKVEVDSDLVFGDTDKERLRNRHWDRVSSIGW